MTFEEFKAIINNGLANGEIKLIGENTELSELDLAIQYAIGMELQGKTKNFTVTASDIANLIKKHCGDETYHRVLE